MDVERTIQDDAPGNAGTRHFSRVHAAAEAQSGTWSIDRAHEARAAAVGHVGVAGQIIVVKIRSLAGSIDNPCSAQSPWPLQARHGGKFV